MINNTPLISIIVPVYNVEKYLSKCIESILHQTYKNWELLLIDDGSHDNSGKICDDYATKDNRIKVIHQSNKGVSIARNKGIDEVSGDYILFLDSDDWLDLDCLEFCTNVFKENNIDIVQIPTVHVSINDFVASTAQKEGIIYNTQDYILNDKLTVCIGGNVIKTEIIQKNNIRFRSDIKLAEDQMFIMDCLKKSNTVYRSDYPFYKYYIREDSATSCSKSTNIIDSIKALTEYKNKYSEFTKIIDCTLLYFIWYIIKNNDVSNRELSRLIKNARIAYNNKFSKVEKGFIYLGQIFPFLSIYYVRLYKYLKI